MAGCLISPGEDLLNYLKTKYRLLKICRNLITAVTSLKEEGSGRLILEGNQVECNCKANDLKEVLMTSESYVLPTTIACQEGEPSLKETPRSSSFFSSPSSKVLLKDFPIASLTCPLAVGCPEPCKCARAPGTVTVDCRYKEYKPSSSPKGMQIKVSQSVVNRIRRNLEKFYKVGIHLTELTPQERWPLSRARGTARGARRGAFAPSS